MEKSAIVIKADEKTATVCVERETACKHCSAAFCPGCKKVITAEIPNSLGARKGDRVTLETPSEGILIYSAMIFVVPVIAALAAYGITVGIGAGVADGLNQYAEIIAAAGFAAAFAGGCFAAMYVSKSRFAIRMTNIEARVAGAEDDSDENSATEKY